MFKENKHHLQPYLISNVNDLPGKQRARLEKSWMGVFFREFFSKAEGCIFDVLYADISSHPYAPIKELVSLEFLKDGNDHPSAEELCGLL